jgi:hypothetical protein
MQKRRSQLKTLKPLPGNRTIKDGQRIMIYVRPCLADAIKILGDGKMARGVRNILDTFEEEIFKAAAKAKKVS